MKTFFACLFVTLATAAAVAGTNNPGIIPLSGATSNTNPPGTLSSPTSSTIRQTNVVYVDGLGNVSSPANFWGVNGQNFWRNAGTNATMSGITSNLDLQAYPAPGDVFNNVHPVPNVYFLSAFGTNALTEAIFKATVDNIVTNGYVSCGETYYQLDAGWASRDTNGNIIFNTNVFTSTGAQLIKYAHDRGVKVGAYINLSPTMAFGQITSGGSNMVADVSNLVVTIGFDGLKIDDTIPGSDNAHIFWSLVGKWNRGTYRQMSLGSTPAYPGALFEMNEYYPKYINSAYPTFGLPDTYDPLNFGNIYTHFTHTIDGVNMGALAYVKPGFYLEGIGWMYANDTSQFYPYPQHVGYDLSAMTCSRVLLAAYGAVKQNAVMNKDWLSILRDPMVRPCDMLLTNWFGGTTNYVLARKLGAVDNDTRALCFLNAAASTNAMTVSSTNLSIATNVFTLYSPWFHSIENWGTNTITVSTPPTNTLLYKVLPGFVTPAFKSGTNYLSDQPFNMGYTDGSHTIDYGDGVSWGSVLGRDYRDGIVGSPLIINATTYTKGFCVGPSVLYSSETNVQFTITLGGVATNLTLSVGKQQAWDGGSAGMRVTVTGDGTQLWQSGWITNNSSQATNVALYVKGVNKVNFLTEGTPASTFQAVLGNCFVLVP